MFSVRFHRVCRRRVRRRNNFCLSRQNHLSLTLHIWHKKYVGLGKCTGWPFHDLDPRSRLWHWLKFFACLRDKVRTTHLITTRNLGLGDEISRSVSEIASSQEWADRLTWNEKDVSHPFMTIIPWYWLVCPWWGGWMYRIVTGVTSNVGVPSTYLVKDMISASYSH